MDTRGSFMAWFGPVVLIAIFMWFLFGNSTSHELLCDGTGSCFRDWIFGMSGWAAAAAAAVTISSLVRQADAAQKQTEFMIGDAPPTFDAVQHISQPSSIILRVLNWNRRSMLIKKITVSGIDNVSVTMVFLDKGYLSEHKIDDSKGLKYHSFGTVLPFSPVLLLDGWLKKDQPPPELKGRLVVFKNESSFPLDIWPNVKVRITYEMTGELGSKSQIALVHAVASQNIIAEDDELFEEAIHPNA